jgi:type I site-specific restriction endonuclease
LDIATRWAHNPKGVGFYNAFGKSERDICTKFITPAVEKSGWNKLTQLLEEVSFTDGKIYVRGKLTAQRKSKTGGLHFVLQAQHSYCYY